MYDEYHDYSYVEGQIIPERIGFPDSYIFDLYDTGAYLLITLNNPTPKELESFAGNGEIRMNCFHSLMFFTFKFGSLEWADASYTPHLSIQASDLSGTLFESCSHMTVVVCNSINGMAVFSGTVKFNDELSAAMRVAVMLILQEDFRKAEHDMFYRLFRKNTHQNKLQTSL